VQLNGLVICFLIFWTSLIDGGNKKKKRKSLFLKIQNYYHRTPSAPARYDNMVVSMFKQKNSYKLRGKAAEVRGLVGFSKELAAAYLDRENPLEATILEATSLLCKCYDCLSHDAPMTDFPMVARQFCLLWKSLHEAHSSTAKWRVKPKAHLLCELAEFTTDKPSKTWCYRDEEFGGTLANLSRLRGGKRQPLAIGVNVLTKFASNFSMPRL
jgi:hypothetical protein